MNEFHSNHPGAAYDATASSNGGSAEELARRNEELAAMNMVSGSIIEHINHALVALDESFRVVRYNQQFHETFQPGEDFGTGSHIGEVFPDGRLESIIRESMAFEESIQELDFNCRVGGEEERHFLLAISRFELPSSNEGTLIAFDEVTEWKRRQFQVMEASRLVSIGEMAAGIAHEINNPLAAVMGFAQLALRRDIDDSIRRDLDKILAESKRASKIISNLQSFARRYKPKKEPINIIESVQKVLNFRAYELQVSNIEVETRIDPNTPIIMGDEHQLDQALLNIVINAEQMMFEAHGGGTLTIGVARVGDKVHISFKDDGPGIERDVIPKIFDPFFTTKEVGKGTGLGLSICYGIIHEHEGNILVESSPGQGAAFTIELPACDMPDADGSDEDTLDLSMPMESLKVLVVDDEPVVADFLSRVMTEFGHAVEVAQCADDVIEKPDLDKYDLVVLDVRMPGVGSEALFERIKQLPDDVSSRVLFITGDTTNPTTRAFIDKTGSPVLTKPFTIEDLMSAVNRMTHKRNRGQL